MPIPASQIVQVNPRLITPGGNDLDFNGLFLTECSSTHPNVIPLSDFVLSFADADDVGSYFGETSEEYELAAIYFAGYSDSFAKPSRLLFAPNCSTAQAAFVRGGEGADLTTIKAITAGTLTIVLGGGTVSLTSLDFSSATSFSNVGSILQTAIRAATPSPTVSSTAVTQAVVEYSSLFEAFTITSGATGEDTTLVYPTGTVANALCLRETDGAVVSEGCAAMTPAAVMNKVLTKTRNFVTFMSIAKLDETAVLAFSAWAALQGVEYLHVYWDNDVNLKSSSSSGTIAQALKDDNASSVCGVYDSAEYAAFVCAIAASIDYDRTNGTITFKFKGQASIGANVDNGTDASHLEDNLMNFMGNYATRNDNFIFLSPGAMFGDYKWIDAYLNAVWLNNAIQVACVNGFVNNPRVPYTEEGYALIRSWIQDPVNRALKSGVIEPGVTLSESQKSQLQREAGRDISSELYNDGYVIQIVDADATVRQNRESPEVNLWITYSGSVHKLTVSSSMIV